MVSENLLNYYFGKPNTPILIDKGGTWKKKNVILVVKRD